MYFDVSASLDVNDLDFPDLLVFAAAEVQRQLSDARFPGFTATSTYLQRVWDDILGALGSEVSISGAEAETPPLANSRWSCETVRITGPR